MDEKILKRLKQVMEFIKKHGAFALKKLNQMTEFVKKHGAFINIAICIMFVLISILEPALAGNDYMAQEKGVVDNMIGIIGFIFQAVGVILAVYSAGQLILAFKNEDADNSKSRTSTQLVVAIALIATPQIISFLNLSDNLK